jgi:hypothetical protein
MAREDLNMLCKVSKRTVSGMLLGPQGRWRMPEGRFSSSHRGRTAGLADTEAFAKDDPGCGGVLSQLIDSGVDLLVG